jgi:hypothetical protein
MCLTVSGGRIPSTDVVVSGFTASLNTLYEDVLFRPPIQQGLSGLTGSDNIYTEKIILLLLEPLRKAKEPLLDNFRYVDGRYGTLQRCILGPSVHAVGAQARRFAKFSTPT